MKIAYLITAYNNPQHLSRLILSLDSPDIDIYLHLDKKSTLNFDLPKKDQLFIIINNHEVYWGGFSMVRAVIKLLQEAKKKTLYDYYYLISGTDYPVKGNKEITDFFSQNKGQEFINFCEIPCHGKGLDRFEYFFYETNLDLKLVSIIKRVLNRSIRIFNIKRDIKKELNGFRLYGGSTWWALSGEAINYILDFYSSNPHVVSFFEHVLIPEESFFQTILGNSPFKKNIRCSLTYADWSIPNSAHPKEFDETHINKLMSGIAFNDYTEKDEPFLFARKFNDNSKVLVEKIQSIRNK